MLAICVTVYLGAWLLTAVGTYVAGRLLADPEIPVENPLIVGLVAGAFWPLTILGALELSSVAAYSKMKSRRAEAEIHRWFDEAAAANVITPLR